MPFVKMPGIIGKVYVPEKIPDAPKKHKCPDCLSCQMCSDDRCALCQGKEDECCCKINKKYVKSKCSCKLIAPRN